MAPKFNNKKEDDGRYKFIVFVQKNKDKFNILIKHVPKNKKRKIVEAYKNFILDFNVDDDAEHGAMVESFEDNWDEYIVQIVKEFVEWFESAEIQEKFNKIIIEQREHKRSKRRSMKRTSLFADELAEKDIVPDDRQNSVFGKTYRTARDKFNSRTGGKKRKTHKKRL